MSVEFYEENSDNYNSQAAQAQIINNPKGLTGAVTKLGFVKSKRGAEGLLLGFAALVFVFSGTLIYKSTNYSANVNPEIAKLQAELELQGYEGGELLVALSEELTK